MTDANATANATAAPGPFVEVPIEITVALGHARLQLGELLKLGRDAVLQLDRRVEDPVDLYVGDRLIARGELVEMDAGQGGRLAVRLTEVADRVAQD